MAAIKDVKFKRTSVPGKVPTTTDIGVGELAINLVDKKLYTANTTAVFELGANNTDLTVSNTATINAISANGSVGLPGQGLTSNGTSIYWSDNPGYTGSQGVTGYVGSQGVGGYTGSKGVDGTIGVDGYTGSQGVIGYTGSAGADGVIGYNGSNGYTGSQGTTGYTGSRGTDGVIGYNGSTGYTGSQGAVGYVGSQGVGYTGSAGPTTSYVFDGGGPTADYSLGPAFDCGGVY